MLSSLDVGQNIVLSGVDVPVISTINKVEILALPIVSGNALFDSEDKWQHIYVKYLYDIDDQSLVFAHRKDGSDWIGKGIFSKTSLVGIWKKMQIVIVDEMNAQLNISRDIIGATEDVTVS